MKQSGGDELTKAGFAENWRAAMIDQAITYSVKHPVRLDCLAILIIREASASEIARELNVSLSTVAHHIHQLYKDGVVEHVKTEVGGSRRGAAENYYRATALPEVTEKDWLVMPPDGRRKMAGRVLQAIITLSLAALRCKLMEADDQLYLGWQPIEVDDEGEDEMAEVFVETAERLDVMKKRCRTRLKETGKEGTVRIAATLSFPQAHLDEQQSPP